LTVFGITAAILLLTLGCIFFLNRINRELKGRLGQWCTSTVRALTARPTRSLWSSAPCGILHLVGPVAANV